jgi:hypothetical protein
MVESAPRFCPRCGVARVADMPFCAGCGLNFAEYETPSSVGPRVGGSQIDAPPPSDVPAPAPTETGPPVRRRLGIPPILMTAAIVVVGVIALALFAGRLTGSSPGSGGQASAVAVSTQPAAPIVGLTILSPTDGQVVASKDVVVLGTAPPGLTITQDISFGFDQHTTVDGTGHWAIKVGLNDGDNKLTFRIGDDHSTQQTIRVIYTPTQTP